MVSSFTSEKHCREETIGAAVKVAQVAVKEHRQFTAAESSRVDALLRTAETVLGLKELARDPIGVLAYSRQKLGGNKQRKSQ